MNNSLKDNYVEEFESFLKDLILNLDIPAEKLKEAILYALFPGGKRLRPLLVFLSGEILQIPPKPLFLIAASIELIHCYSLIHDDLPAMDDDDYRRGKLSLHKAFDEATAILAGDALQALAFEILLEFLPNYLTMEQTIEISKELAKASGVSGMVSGQSLDLSLLSDENLTEETLRLIHSLKTGKLICAAINMTILAAKATPVEIKALKDYAAHLGLVFQIQDDYLDCYGSHSLGKGRASDQVNNKKTFTAFYGKEALVNLINTHFNIAKERLSIFGEKADSLMKMTSSIENRH